MRSTARPVPRLWAATSIASSCAFPVCILHRQKLALPELGLNKAEGRSKRPCDAISTRQLAQSSQHVDGEDDDDDGGGGGDDDDVEEHED